MVEHSPWIGENYGKNGYPVMLWGFSHHQPNDADDYIEMTRRTIEEEALTDRHWFFQRIKNIFGEKNSVAFWESVAFANTLPNAVSDSNIYSDGDTSDAARAALKSRVSRTLEELKPRKVIVFSRKGWILWPEFNGSHPERSLARAPIVKWGSYKTSAPWETIAYNLPHPQFQRIDEISAAVKEIMAHDGT